MKSSPLVSHLRGCAAVEIQDNAPLYEQPFMDAPCRLTKHSSSSGTGSPAQFTVPTTSADLRADLSHRILFQARLVICNLRMC